MSLKEEQIFVKHMVCTRCVEVLRETLEELGVTVVEVKLGMARIQYDDREVGPSDIATALQKHRFELVKNEEVILVEKIKHALIDLVEREEENKPRLSDYLTDIFHSNYAHLSRLFSRREKRTIEKYYIRLRIEKAKELIEYGDLNFSEIAWRLGYSSPQHLSGQFKQVTGMSMREYKSLQQSRRNPLDKIL